MIDLILGPMFSAKSTYLIQNLERGILANKKVCFCRLPIDTRDFICRSCVSMTYKFDIKKLNSIIDLENIIQTYQVIAIDEFQFFPYIEELLKFIYKYPNKQFYLAGLNASAEQHMFTPIIEILPYATNIIYLKSVCTKCGNYNATYTIALFDKKTQVHIGDTEYTVLCEDCFKLYRESQNDNN